MTTPPTPSAPPEPIRDWASWSAEKHAALHPNAPQPPTAEELHRYAVAWGHADPAILTDWREWEKRYNDTLNIIVAMAHERDALEARLAALTLTPQMRGMLQVVQSKYDLCEYTDLRGSKDSDVEQDIANLLVIIARLTRTDGDA